MAFTYILRCAGDTFYVGYTENLASRPSFISQPEEDSETFSHIGEDFSGRGCGELHAPSVPVQILDVVGQDDACDSAVVGQSHLERIAFRVTRDRAGNRKAGFRVIRARGQDQCWSATTLLVASLRVEREPDKIARIRDVAAGYHTSFPRLPPQSRWSWRFFGVMRWTSSSSE